MEVVHERRLSVREHLRSLDARRPMHDFVISTRTYAFLFFFISYKQSSFQSQCPPWYPRVKKVPCRRRCNAPTVIAFRTPNPIEEPRSIVVVRQWRVLAIRSFYTAVRALARIQLATALVASSLELHTG